MFTTFPFTFSCYNRILRSTVTTTLPNLHHNLVIPVNTLKKLYLSEQSSMLGSSTVGSVCSYSPFSATLIQLSCLYFTDESIGRHLRQFVKRPFTTAEPTKEGKLHADRVEQFHTTKLIVMRQLCTIKFINIPDLKALLLSSTGSCLAKALSCDDFWGCNRGPWDPRSRRPKHWTGANHLGTILMNIRGTLLQLQSNKK